MKKGVRYLSYLLTANILFSFFFFLGTTSCHVVPSFTQNQGGFCAIEKASAPMTLSFEDPHVLLLKELLVLSAFIVVFTYVRIIITQQRNDSKRTHRKNTGIIRYGPHQKLFLPYLTATHGM